MDPATRARVSDIDLRADAYSIEATHGPQPLLVAATVTGELDVYDALSGKFVRTIGGHIARKATAIQAVR